MFQHYCEHIIKHSQQFEEIFQTLKKSIKNEEVLKILGQMLRELSPELGCKSELDDLRNTLENYLKSMPKNEKTDVKILELINEYDEVEKNMYYALSTRIDIYEQFTKAITHESMKIHDYLKEKNCYDVKNVCSLLILQNLCNRTSVVIMKINNLLKAAGKLFLEEEIRKCDI